MFEAYGTILYWTVDNFRIIGVHGLLTKVDCSVIRILSLKREPCPYRGDIRSEWNANYSSWIRFTNILRYTISRSFVF